MDLSLFYFVFAIFTLLPTADQTELNLDTCPTSRRLLFFGRFNFSLGEKKSDHVSSYLKGSSPVKHARKDQKPSVTIYIQPQTSAELGHKVRSFSHLLKPKLIKEEEERTKTQKSKLQKKKPSVQKTIKKKNTTQHNTKTRDLVAVNDEERERCRALLHIDQEKTLTPSKDTKKTKDQKKLKPSKKNNVTVEVKKKKSKSTKPLPVDEKPKSSKAKFEKDNKKSTSNEKKKTPIKKSSESQPLTPPPPTTTNQASTKNQKPVSIPPKTSNPLPSTPPPPISPPPISQSSTNTKSKREKTLPITTEPTATSDVNDPINIDHHEKNNSVVDRAYHFVRNMFQLSDDILENNYTHEDDQILSSINEEQHRQSRKLLSIDDQETILNDTDDNDWDFDELNDKQSFVSFNDLPLSYVNILKRQLLSVKKNKRSIPIEASYVKTKRSNSAANKPKVGWAYRYRISRYLADQKMKRSAHARKPIGGGKFHSQPIQQKMSSSVHTKFSKRKLLGFNIDDESDSDINDISNEDIVNTVSITQEFVPKRQLFTSKKVNNNNNNVNNHHNHNHNHEEETDDEDDIEKVNERRRMKSYEEMTDPVEIVRSYESGLFKPRVGWQFRYRVSRYIDSLRENIREDQERLKLGLEAIKRKTPQELSGRRKRVLDKPFASEAEEVEAPVEDNKPHVGWRYRYRISKMLEAKARGEYIDDEEEKRKARLEQKRKQPGTGKSIDDDDECVEWEYDLLDPELRKINEEGRRVGWAYRYRIRRKLDHLKRQQAESGIAFDWETLTSELDKKTTPTPSPTKDVPTENLPEVNKKSVGWKYRYRVSKMLEAQQREAFEALLKGKREDQIPLHERLDPELARLTPEERAVGWQYRYRIRRKLDAIKNATRESQAGKRGRKHRRDKEKIIKKVEESIEKILNIDDIDETPFMEYFRRTSSYILFGLVPTGRKSICLLPLPVKFSFCNEDGEVKETLTTTATVTTSSSAAAATTTTASSSSSSESVKPISTKKARTQKKEKRPIKQSISSRSIKSDASDENIAEPMKPVTKTPVKTIEKSQKKPSRERLQVSTRYQNDEQVKHYDEEEQPVRKLVGVESQKNKNKKRFQIIGKEVKNKPKHSTPTPTPTTTTTNPPPAPTTTSATPIKTTTKTESTMKTNAPKPSSTTTPAPLRSISEIIQEEAATFVSTKTTYPEEAAEEVNEANESLQATTTTTITTSTPSSSPATSNLDDNTMSDEEDNESSSSDTDSDSDSESTSTEDSNENDDNSDDISPMKKIKQIYENAKASVHDVFDLQDEKDSS